MYISNYNKSNFRSNQPRVVIMSSIQTDEIFFKLVEEENNIPNIFFG